MDNDKALIHTLRQLPMRLVGGLSDNELLQIARAALAAADKVRAEGEFNFFKEAQELLESDYTAHFCTDAAEVGLRRAFAAGLAKGAVERAALVGALEQIRAWPNHTRDDLADTVQRMQTIARDVLALVRKGV